MTRSLLALVPALLALLALPACNSSDSLTCDLLGDPSNCWASAALSAASCLPVDAVGVLAADRASCTFEDGTQVLFDTPLPTNGLDLERLAFTIERGGETCARFVDTFENRIELTANGSMVVTELHSGSDFHLHCDGQSFSAPFDRLFECATMGIPAPTDGFDVQAERFDFTLASISTPGPLFTCTPTGTLP